VTNRADYFIYRGRLKEFEEQERKAIVLSRESGNLSEVLGRYLGYAEIRINLLGDLDGARRLVEEALTDVPFHSLNVEARPYIDLIILYARLGDVEQARSLREEYERLVPERLRKGDLRRFQGESELLLAEGRLEEALEIMRQSQSVDRCYVCFYDEQARLLERMDSLDAAIQLLEEFTDYSMSGLLWFLAPRQPIANFHLGELHVRLGNIDEAIEAYTKFVNLWNEADDELQPQVQHARNQIESLLDQSLREPQ